MPSRDYTTRCISGVIHRVHGVIEDLTPYIRQLYGGVLWARYNTRYYGVMCQAWYIASYTPPPIFNQSAMILYGDRD